MLKVRIGIAEDGSFGTWFDRDGGKTTVAQPADYVELLNYLVKLKDRYGDLTLEPVSPGPGYQPVKAEQIAEINDEL